MGLDHLDVASFASYSKTRKQSKRRFYSQLSKNPWNLVREPPGGTEVKTAGILLKEIT